MTSSPTIFAPDAKTYCQRHLEPFREKWPSGYGVFTVLLMQHVLGDERFTSGFPRGDDGLDTPGMVERVNERLATLGCAACFVGDAVAAMVTKRALTGDRGE